ncbi:LacI family transcriptional regulator [Devosia epidermidihirudinis]|uniref:LacI family transcriptional regulator n=1 Tax=Devosia epidermidihirudinis TaxID=1293439 RepID=A0A0F5Q437_9HYPH|nr:LacI family transcriptional regulator [Devosia epidermidihirudinis]
MGVGVAKGSEASVKLKDVAKAAGVSQGTASNVFSRPDVVREEVRERVLKTAKELGYAGPSLTGRLLRAGKVNAIGVATVEPMKYFFEDPFARALMAGIAEACDANGAGLSLVSAGNPEKLAWNIQSALVDGFVLLCVDGGERLVELTRERQLPFMALSLGTDDASIPALVVDNIGGAAAAARHLVELGHRQIAVLSTEYSERHYGRVTAAQADASLYSTSHDRITGYWQVLEAAGISRDAMAIFETRNNEESVAACLEDLFANGPRPTAILAMSDRIALIAMDWLQRRGIAVPGEVSIVGFDGVPEAAASVPPLTTIAQPIAELGRRAVLAILNEGPQGREMLPVELVVRGSTAAPS